MTAEAVLEPASMLPVEKAKSDKRLWVVVILVGFVLTAWRALWVSSRLFLRDNAGYSNIAYIKEQALVYDSYNAASDAQSALRA